MSEETDLGEAAKPEPATVITVTVPSGKKRRYAADGLGVEDGVLAVGRSNGENIAAVYAKGHWTCAFEEDAVVPGAEDGPEGGPAKTAQALSTEVLTAIGKFERDLGFTAPEMFPVRIAQLRAMVRGIFEPAEDEDGCPDSERDMDLLACQSNSDDERNDQ
jgi:hypothetical protein